MTSWVCFHIFLSDPVNTARFLVEWLAPYAEQVVRSGRSSHWFYIQYWEGGPHIRLRFAVTQTDIANQIQTDIEQAIAPFKSNTPLERKSYYENHSFDGQPVDVNSLPWYQEGAVVQLPYQAEIVRYGGVHAIDISERLFALSSQIAVSIIKATLEAQGARLSASLKLMTAAVLAVKNDPHYLHHFFDRYASFWRDYSDQSKNLDLDQIKVDNSVIKMLKQQLGSVSANAKDASTVWRRGVQSSVNRLGQLYSEKKLISPLLNREIRSEDEYRQAIDNLVSSHIHMLNNRLGIYPAQEVYLSYCLAQAAGDLNRE